MHPRDLGLRRPRRHRGPRGLCGFCLVSLLACPLLVSPRAAQAQIFEAVTLASAQEGSASGGALFLTDGQHLLSAPQIVGSSLLLGLARNPKTGELVSIAPFGSQLVHVDFQNGIVTPFGPPFQPTLRSLAFDSTGQLYGFALCDPIYGNALFQIDPVSGNLTGSLGSLDSSQVESCLSLPAPGGAIAIDPATDTLYLAANDVNGDFFIDSFDTFLVPHLLYIAAPSVLKQVPLAATFAHGKLWVTFGASLLGPGGAFLSFDPSNPSTATGTGGAAYRFLSLDNEALVYGLVEGSPSCVPTATAACLFNRFKIAATYDATPANGTGPATVLLESPESVKFTFFDPANVELLLKIINACSPPFNHWWVSGGGLTNVGVQITVTDTMTGKTRSYSSAKGQLFQTFFDTSAFSCP